MIWVAVGDELQPLGALPASSQRHCAGAWRCKRALPTPVHPQQDGTLLPLQGLAQASGSQENTPGHFGRQNIFFFKQNELTQSSSTIKQYLPG